MWVVPLKNGGFGLRLCIQPKARKTQILGIHDDMVKLAVAAPPVDGKANKQVVDFLSGLFGTRKSDIVIISGQRSRRKVCLIGNLPQSEISKRIETCLATGEEKTDERHTAIRHR